MWLQDLRGVASPPPANDNARLSVALLQEAHARGAGAFRDQVGVLTTGLRVPMHLARPTLTGRRGVVPPSPLTRARPRA